MPCNGRNHQPSCTCSFGGRRNSHSSVISWNGWTRTAIRGYSGPWSKCPVCQIGVYYIPGPRGGGTFFDCLGPPWTLHPCTSKRLKYSPFGRTGKPKLRMLRTELQEIGFLPLVVQRIEALSNGVILHGVLWDTPTALHLGTTEIVEADICRPVYVYQDGSGWAIVNYFPINGFEPVNIRMREDTLGPLDLLMSPPHRASNGQ